MIRGYEIGKHTSEYPNYDYSIKSHLYVAGSVVLVYH